MFINKSKTIMQNKKDKRGKEKLVIQLLQNPKLSSHMKRGRTKEPVNNFTKTKNNIKKHKSQKEKLVEAMHIHWSSHATTNYFEASIIIIYVKIQTTQRSCNNCRISSWKCNNKAKLGAWWNIFNNKKWKNNKTQDLEFCLKPPLFIL